jgi:hypothetical protein
MDVLELPNKSEKIVSFAWEPKGHRFAVVHGDGPRFSVSFYSMRDEKNRLAPRLLGELSWLYYSDACVARTGRMQFTMMWQKDDTSAQSAS